MRRWLVLLVVALLMMPSAAMAQEATPGAEADPFLRGDGVSVLVAQSYDENGIAILGVLDSYFGPVLAVAYHNNGPLLSERDGEITITARTADGDLFGVGELNYRGLAPITIYKGSYAFGIASFGDAIITNDLVFTSQVDHNPGSRPVTSYENMTITELNRYPHRIVGTVHNSMSTSADGSWISALCFGDLEDPVWFYNNRAVDSSIASNGGESAFQVDIPSDVSCQRYVIAAFADPI